LSDWDRVSTIQSSGFAGERIASGLLARSFVVHDISVDRDGTDFMLYPRLKDGNLRAMEEGVSSWAHVQAKYVAARGYTTLPSKYAEDEFGARPHFFVSIISEDDTGEPVYYFMTAQEVLSLPENKLGLRTFSLRDGIDKSPFRRSRRDVEELVEMGMKAIKGRVEDRVIDTALSGPAGMVSAKRFFQMRKASVSTHSDTEYHLLNMNLNSSGARDIAHIYAKTIMAVVPGETEARAIDARWDLVESPGTWAWGYGGKGPKIAAASILAHFMGTNGADPSPSEVESMLFGILANLDEFNSHIILGSRINRVLSSASA